MIKVFGLPLTISTFPNGELNMAKIEEQTLEHIKNPNHPYSHIGIITFKYETDADLMTLYFLSQLPVIKSFVNTLDIVYMPYSRMDRGGYSSSDCTLRHVAQMIQSMNFKKITVCDPHSDLTLAYLGINATAYYPFIKRIPVSPAPSLVILFPDAGAQKRYAGMKCFKDHKQIVGNKVRDFKTGKITSYEIPEGACVEDKFVTIVDDLCSYGGTFKLAGDELKKFKPKSIDLLVSHCEKSIFKGVLFDANSPIDIVVTTNSIVDEADAINQSKLVIERIF